MIKPLESVPKIASLISDITGSPIREVARRLAEEADEIGMNVSREVLEKEIPFFEASDALDRFYRDSDCFLYETTMWNTCDAKQGMRDFAVKQIQLHAPDQSRIFCFGDGLGFDSTFLAAHGHEVAYYEPSTECRNLASRIFSANGVKVQQLTELEQIQSASLDVVVCLDVLEHVPQPQNLVARFSHWLKPGGLLIVHAPFWCLHWTRCTHLKENRRFSGEMKTLYQQQGFQPLDAAFFWDPIAFVKESGSSRRSPSMPAKMRIRIGQPLLTIGRWNSTLYNFLARRIAKPPASWRMQAHEYRAFTARNNSSEN